MSHRKNPIPTPLRGGGLTGVGNFAPLLPSASDGGSGYGSQSLKLELGAGSEARSVSVDLLRMSRGYMFCRCSPGQGMSSTTALSGRGGSSGQRTGCLKLAGRWPDNRILHESYHASSTGSFICEILRIIQPGQSRVRARRNGSVRAQRRGIGVLFHEATSSQL